MLRLYAPTLGNGSLRVVARGMTQAAQSCGLYAGTYSLDEQDPDRLPEGACAPAAIVVGNPSWLPIARSAGIHHELALQYAPNSPDQPRWIHNLALHQGVDRIIVPSSWCAKILLDSWGSAIPVQVVQHGVSPDFYPSEKQHMEGDLFMILHHAGSDPQRKGTFELLRAMSMWTDPNVWLFLSCSTEMGMIIRSHPDYKNCGKCSILTGGVAPVDQYHLVHVVCQPSRSEGFGMVPLEARACGVPVVITVATGHAEHSLETPANPSKTDGIFPSFLSPGVCDIETGENAPMDCELGGLAPTVSPDAILSSLVEVRNKFTAYKKAALDSADWVRQNWSWEARVAPLVEEMCERAKEKIK